MRYESDLRSSFHLEGDERPQFDLVALGMGPDGHTASLFPHTAALHERSRLVVANHVPQKDTWRITLTWPVINHASSVFFLIAGADKAEILKEVLTGPRDPESLPSQLIWPSSGILTLILDKAAAALLPATDGEGCGVLERER
jgi:6-phosphogluconolactonase